MGTYLVKGKGWRYDFVLRGTRYTDQWYRTKAEARRAEVQKREEISIGATMTPQSEVPADSMAEAITPTGMVFLDLVNRRLDHVKAYNSERHYMDYLYMAKRWVRL